MKKTIIFFCAALMVLSLLSGCQGLDIGNDVTDTSTSISSGEQDIEENSAPESSASSDEKAADTNTAEESSTPSGEQGAVQNTVSESLADKLALEIDSAYAKELELPEASSTIGMIEAADKYTDKWKQVADEYYNKIMAYDSITQPSEEYYSSDDLHTFVSNMKTSWELYNQVQCENYLKTLQTIYGGGTIVGPIMADYKYDMQKEWALRLVQIYQQL